MITDRQQISLCIDCVLQNIYEDGALDPYSFGDLRVDQVWPWDVSDVFCVHTHMKGTGDGIWFRLKNSTVWNVDGEAELFALLPQARKASRLP